MTSNVGETLKGGRECFTINIRRALTRNKVYSRPRVCTRWKVCKSMKRKRKLYATSYFTRCERVDTYAFLCV